MDWTTVLNLSHCHRAAHKITDQMYKEVGVLIGPSSMLQEGYIEGRTKKIGDNNAGDDDADAAQTKTKSPNSKK